MIFIKTYEKFNIGSPLLDLENNVDFDLINIIKSTVPSGSDILEISCGNGSDSAYLSSIGYKVICSETNDDYVENARSIGLECLNHDTRNTFPFKDGQFDLIYSRLGLHYFTVDELDKILKELSRIGDKLLITVKLVNDIQTNKVILTEKVWKESIGEYFTISKYKVQDGVLYGSHSKWLEILASSK